MKYTSYEQMLEDQSAGGTILQCPKCEGFEFNGVCGAWEVVNEEEVFVPCSQCDGRGEGTERELGL